MTTTPLFDFAPRDDDEGLFSRDIDGQLVRLDPATDQDYSTKVRLKVDGESVELPKAEPLTDSQGNIVLDVKGRTTPRYTTILDAVFRLNNELRGRCRTEIFVPTLCHQRHMTPVAVCRLCMVQVFGMKNGRLTPERKLLPACQNQVQDGMEVFTMASPDHGARVKRAVGALVGMLMSHQVKSGSNAADELQEVAKRCAPESWRFAHDMLAQGAGSTPMTGPPRDRRALDSSSPVFVVDHNNCILCDRCIRACHEVVKNDIIGRTGKGRNAGIGFDLNDKMFDSNCVQCGECMVSCPTTAITFRPLKKIRARPNVEPVPLAEIARDPLFEGVPRKILEWQNDLVVRRSLKAGDVLCRQGDPGNFAFIIRRGRLRISQRDTSAASSAIDRTAEHVIVGEMACLSGMPRNADIAAVEDTEIWEVRRNVLDRMMRSPVQRSFFDRIFRDRALATVVRTSEFFAGLPPEESGHISDVLRPKLKFVRVSPRQIIFNQGDVADCMYLIRLGYVRVGVTRYGKETMTFFRGPGTVIGEIGLLALSRGDADKNAGDVDRAVCAALDRGDPLTDGIRTAACLALDHVELARVDRADFLDTIRRCPVLRMRIIRIALDRLKEL